MNASKQSNIESKYSIFILQIWYILKYDKGFNFEMLQYGIHNIKYPSSSIVTDINRKLIENYVSEKSLLNLS